MKTTCLIGLLLIVTQAFGQRRTATLHGKTTYELNRINDTLLGLDTTAIFLQFDDVVQDTCRWKNSLVAEFEIKNNTTSEMGYNAQLNCWNDCGFQRYEKISSNFQFIKPGETAKVKVYVNNEHKIWFDTQSQFYLLTKQGELEVPIRLKLKYTTKDCL